MQSEWPAGLGWVIPAATMVVTGGTVDSPSLVNVGTPHTVP